MRIARVRALALLLLALAACGETGGESTEESAPDRKPGQEALWLAVHPYDTPSRLVVRFTPLCEYLSDRIGRPVRLHLAPSYGSQIRSIAAGEVDFAYMGPAPYLRLSDHFLARQATPAEIIAGEEVAGEPGYRGVFIARASSSIQRLEDLPGHSLALTSPRSFAGHFVPRKMLHDAGVDLTDLLDYEFLGSHERVALAVAHGDFEAGALRRDVAELYLDRGLKIIATSALLPPHVIVARPGLERALVEAVRAALLDRGPAAQRAFAAVGAQSRFAPFSDAGFAEARRIVAEAEAALPREHAIDP